MLEGLLPHLRVAKRLLWQSWLPLLLALAYGAWDFNSLQADQRTAAAFVRSSAVAFFLIMWFIGQWFRASKQLSDAEQFGALRNDNLELLRLVRELAEAGTESDGSPAGGTAFTEDPVQRVLDEAKKSPKGALMLVGAELERELRHLLWRTGWMQGAGDKPTVTRSIEHLTHLGVAPKNLGSSARLFLDIRNRVLHGHEVAEEEVQTGIAVGISMLRAVHAVPSEENRVYHPGVEIYKDRDGTKPVPGFLAVILETQRPGIAKRVQRVFLTTRTDYKKGQRLSWEWNMKVSAGPSWIRHPDTNELQQAWASCSEFVGRELDSL